MSSSTSRSGSGVVWSAMPILGGMGPGRDIEQLFELRVAAPDVLEQRSARFVHPHPQCVDVALELGAERGIGDLIEIVALQEVSLPPLDGALRGETLQRIADCLDELAPRDPARRSVLDLGLLVAEGALPVTQVSVV